MSETRSHAHHGGGSAASARAPLTHTPLSSATLPPLDTSVPPWPGAFERLGTSDVYVRTTPGLRGETVVYLHGLGGSSTNWTDLAAQLAPYATGLAVDLPGFGFSEPSAGFDFTLWSQADAVADYIDHLDSGGVHVVGNSMGGAVALLLAARRGDLVRTLTLISPAMPDRRPDPRRLSDPKLAAAYLPLIGARVRRQLAQVSPRERAEQVIRLCFANPSHVPEKRLAELAQEHGARAEFAWAGPAQAHSTFAILRHWFARGQRSLWAVAPRVRAPTLVVWGAEDKVVSVRRATRTTRLLPRGRLLALPRTGHVAQMERPVTVARAILGMWDSVADNDW